MAAHQAADDPAASPRAPVFGARDGVLEVSTGFGISKLPMLIPPQATTAGSLVEVDLPLPPDARIEQALFEVIAEPVARAKLSSIADIRQSTPTVPQATSAATVDFGRLITVGGLVGDEVSASELGVDYVQRWTGGAWSYLAAGPDFAETATERLLVQSVDGEDDAPAVAGRLTRLAAAILPVVPPSLEVLVDGRTVWFERQGDSPVDVGEPASPGPASGVRYIVDRTDAVREAFDRAIAASSGSAAPVTVRVALRAAAPGALRLIPHLSVLRVHTHPFPPPQGLAVTLDLAEEGAVEVDVTPPQVQAVHEVALTVRGSFGPTRVQPPAGPEINTAAVVVLAVGRSLLVGLPVTLASQFAMLTGVRLSLRAPAGGSGGQVTGKLLAVTPGGRAGDLVAGGMVTPVQVTDASLRWYTLPFAKPVPAPPAPSAPTPPASGATAGAGESHVAAWLELQAGYGEVECGLTRAEPSDPLAPGGLLRRRLSGGAVAELTAIPAVDPPLAAIRMVGLPDRDHPLAAASLQVVGEPDNLGLDPGTSGVQVRLTMRNPVRTTGPVLLRATCAAAGSLTFDTVRVTYQGLEVPS